MTRTSQRTRPKTLSIDTRPATTVHTACSQCARLVRDSETGTNHHSTSQTHQPNQIERNSSSLTAMRLTASFCAQSADADPVLDNQRMELLCSTVHRCRRQETRRDGEVASTGFSNFTLGNEPHSRRNQLASGARTIVSHKRIEARKNVIHA